MTYYWIIFYDNEKINVQLFVKSEVMLLKTENREGLPGIVLAFPPHCIRESI